MRIIASLIALSSYISLAGLQPAAALPFMQAKKKEPDVVQVKSKSEVKKESKKHEVPGPAHVGKVVKGPTPELPVPVEFAGGVSGATNGTTSGALTAHHDPLIIYRAAGISPAEERKIRQHAAEYEGMLRVRMKLLENLNKQMAAFQYQSEPDSKTVLAKQDEINKLTILMANDRIKLLFAIRDCMTHDERMRLVEELERKNGIQHVEVSSPLEFKSADKSEAKSDESKTAEKEAREDAAEEAAMQSGSMSDDTETEKPARGKDDAEKSKKSE